MAEYIGKCPNKLSPTTKIQRDCPPHLKSSLSASYLKVMPEGTKDFRVEGPKIAFRRLESISLSDVHMKYRDMTAFVYFTEANNALRNLRIVSARLSPTALELLFRHLSTGLWPLLSHLDVSFSAMDFRTMQALVEGLTNRSNFSKLRLAGCRITPASVVPLATFIGTNPSLEDLDLAFNTLEANGAQYLADALLTNSHLVSLNIRQNRIRSQGACF